MRDGLDAHIAAVEHHDFSGSSPSIMRMEHDFLVETGLLAPDEPTRWSHYLHRQAATRDFTKEERMQIRLLLGLPPYSAKEHLQHG